MKNYLKVISIYLLGLFSLNTLAGKDPVVWKFQTGGKIHATPVIHNNIVYIGSFDSTFYAIKSSNGEEVWHYKTNNKILTTAAIYEDIICFESGNILYGLDLQGNFLWLDTLYNGIVTNQHDIWDCFRSSPGMKDSIAYIGSEEGNIIGVNVKTGERTFHCQTPEPNHTIETTPLIYNNKIYVGDWDGEFYVYNLETAALEWSYDTKNDNTYGGWVNAITTDPVIYNDSVIFGGRSCNLYSLDAGTGEKNWMYHEADMWMVGGPTVADSNIYMGSSYQRIVYAFNANSGDKLWTTSVNNLVYGKPVVAGDKIYAGASNDNNTYEGYLVVLDRNSHEIISWLNLFGQVYSTPVILSDTLYAGNSNGNVYAIDKHKLDIYMQGGLPDIYLKTSGIIDLDTLSKLETYNTELWIYNQGDGEDSITVTTSHDILTVDTESFVLSPSDSFMINLEFDFPSLETSTRFFSITITSHLSLGTSKKVQSFRVTYLEDITGIPDVETKGDLVSCKVYPNPFNEMAEFVFSIEKSCHVRLELFNLQGQEIATLINAFYDKGVHKYELSCDKLTSNIYYYRLIAGKNSIQGKIIFMGNG